MSDAETVTVPPQEVMIAAALISLIMVILYGINLWECWLDWRKYRSVQALRGFIMATVLWAGMLTIFLGAIAGAFFLDSEWSRELLRNSRYLLWGLILAAGFGLTAAWLWQRKRHG